MYLLFRANKSEPNRSFDKEQGRTPSSNKSPEKTLVKNDYEPSKINSKEK